MDNESINSQNLVIARRPDGIGTRLMNLLCARLFSEQIGRKLVLAWPDISQTVPFYSENILNFSSCDKVFKNNEIFNDIDNVAVIDDEDYGKIVNNENSVILSNFLPSNGLEIFRPGSHKLLVDPKLIDNIQQYKYIIYDFPLVLEWQEKESQNNLNKIKYYWQNFNWHNDLLSKLDAINLNCEVNKATVIHLRRGDVLKYFLYGNIVGSDIVTGLLQRFLPVKTAYNKIIHSDLDNFIICSESSDIAEEFKCLLPGKKVITTSNFFPDSEDQQAIFDLLVMSQSKQVISSPLSYFSTCAGFCGSTTLITCSFDWDNIYDEIKYELNKNLIQDKDERLAFLCLTIAKNIKLEHKKWKFYNNLAKKHSLKIYEKFMNKNDDLGSLLSTILIMKPKPSPVKLIRIGGEQDGAYLIPDDLDGIKACFSPGVANRKTFEDELTDIYGIQCHMCDKSSDIEKFETPLRKGMQTFKKKWLDVNDEPDSLSLDAWVKELVHDEDDDLILQMDIEGAEYRNILKTSNQVLKMFRIIVVEVHNLEVAQNLQEFEIDIGPFFRKLDENFICVHAHPNNCCGDFMVTGTNINLPRVYELTFLRRDRFNEKNISSWYEPMMPHPLDIKSNVITQPPIFLSEESPTQVHRNPVSTIRLLQDKLDYYTSMIMNKEIEKNNLVIQMYKLAQSIDNKILLEQDINIDSKNITDVAEGKHYYLSSSYSHYPKQGLVETKEPFFFHTEFGMNQYITIDLEEEYILTSLLIVNRLDECTERARCLFYTLHDSLQPNISFGLPLNINESFWQGDNLECNTILRKVKARYISIFSPENTALHFSSLKVFGTM